MYTQMVLLYGYNRLDGNYTDNLSELFQQYSGKFCPTEEIQMRKFGASKIQIRYTRYRQKIRHIWEEYSLLNYYVPYLHQQIKSGAVDPYDYTPFLAHNNEIKKKTVVDSLSTLGEIKENSIKNRLLTNSISIFEDYLCDTTKIVYSDNPGRIKSETNESEHQRYKLINVILDSQDRNEIISRIIEEKVRSMFYGNPVDFFEKDKAKLGFGTYFKDNYKLILKEYREITARRNIIVHNMGKIDQKYIREVKCGQDILGKKITFEENYLKRTLCILDGLAAEVTLQIIQNIYKRTTPKGKLKSSVESFRQNYIDQIKH